MCVASYLRFCVAGEEGLGCEELTQSLSWWWYCGGFRGELSAKSAANPT